MFVTFYDEDCLAAKIMGSIPEKYNLELYIVYLKRFATEPIDFRSSVKSHGYDFLYNGIKYVSNPSSINEKEKQIFIDLIRKLDPGLILISTRTFGLEITRPIFMEIRKLFNVQIIGGGWGPTLQPEKFLEFCDYVCFGEGEKCFEEICENVKGGNTNFREVNNLAYKSDGKMIENPVFPPLTDEEYDEYYRNINYSFNNAFLIDEDRIVNNYQETPEAPHVYLGKGCPLNCTYCMSSRYHEMYKGKGYTCKKYRVRSVDSAIMHLEMLKRNGAKIILFRDEIFPFEKKWLSDFLREYRTQICLPFFGYLRPEFHDPEMIKEIIGSGMYSTTLGIQSGSDYIRRIIYKRMTKKSGLIRFATYLKKTAVYFETHFMCNCPFETEKDLIETLDFICQLPFSNIKVFHFTAFPNSPIDVMIKRKRPEALASHIYNWYSVLYCMAAKGPISRKFAMLLHRRRLFINSPEILTKYYFYRAEIRRILVEQIPEPLKFKIKRIMGKE